MTAIALERRFVRWNGMRAVLHNGWWLVASVYMVIDAGLSPAEIVAIGAAQGGVALLSEIPAGVLADTVSRKWSLVVSHGLMGAAMLLTGLVTDFPALTATQMLWGLSWCFASGADVAWITDELDRPDAIGGVLARAARAQLTGAAAGLIAVGLLAWAAGRSTALVVAGAAMLLLGGYVVAGFPERRFVPARSRRWAASWRIFAGGLTLVRRSREILLMFTATVLINGAADAGGRLHPKALVDIGFPSVPDVIVWFTGLGVLTLGVGAIALRLAERRIDGGHARRSYAAAAVTGALGALLLAVAPDPVAGAAAVVLVNGITAPLTRIIGTVWVNARTTSDVRATVHSFLAQAEYLGEIAFGLAIAVIAQLASLPAAMAGCAALYAATAVVISRGARPQSPSG